MSTQGTRTDNLFELYVTNIYAQNTTTTGATVLNGSLDIPGNLFVKGNLSVSGATTMGGYLHVVNSAGGAVMKVDTSGNIWNAGTLNVSGAVALASSLNVSGATNSVGNFSVNGNRLMVDAATGNTAIAGTLSVSGSLNVSGATNSVGNFSVNGNRLTVDAATGNTAIAGTLSVSGSLNVSGATNSVGNFSVNGNRLTVNAATGNTVITGTLTVSGYNITGKTNITNNFTLAVGSGNPNILTSPDGKTWSADASSSGGQIHDVQWNGAQWVAAGVSGIQYSADGYVWRSATTIGWVPSGIIYDPSYQTLVLVGGTGILGGATIKYSTDFGFTWNDAANDFDTMGTAIDFGGGYLAACGVDSVCSTKYSANGGKTWINLTYWGNNPTYGIHMDGNNPLFAGISTFGNSHTRWSMTSTPNGLPSGTQLGDKTPFGSYNLTSLNIWGRLMYGSVSMDIFLTSDNSGNTTLYKSVPGTLIRITNSCSIASYYYDSSGRVVVVVGRDIAGKNIKYISDISNSTAASDFAGSTFSYAGYGVAYDSVNNRWAAVGQDASGYTIQYITGTSFTSSSSWSNASNPFGYAGYSVRYDETIQMLYATGVDVSGGMAIIKKSADGGITWSNVVESGYYTGTYAGKLGVTGTFVPGNVTNIQLSYPRAICRDSKNNLYITNPGHSSLSVSASPIPNIVKISPTGTATNFYSGSAMSRNTFAICSDSSDSIFIGQWDLSFGVTKFSQSGTITTFRTSITPRNICSDASKNIYVASYDSNTIHKLTYINDISYSQSSYAGLSSAGNIDSDLTSSSFTELDGICCNSNNIFFVVANFAIRRINATNVSTFAGSSGNSGFVDANGSTARFGKLTGIWVDLCDNLYVSDNGNKCIRKIDTNANVTTFAGYPTSAANDGLFRARYNHPWGGCVDIYNNVYVATTADQVVRKITYVSPQPQTTQCNGITWSGQSWYSLGTSNISNMNTSTHGSLWSPVLVSSIYSVKAVASNGSMILACGAGLAKACIQYSTDWIAWLPTSIHGTANSVATNGDTWVVAGSTMVGSLLYSTDGVIWNSCVGSVPTVGNSVAWNGAIWVAVGSGTNTIVYSINGITWYPATGILFTASGNAVRWNGTVWSAIGDRILYSNDGITWIQASSPVSGFIGYGLSARIPPVDSALNIASVSAGNMTAGTITTGGGNTKGNLTIHSVARSGGISLTYDGSGWETPGYPTASRNFIYFNGPYHSNNATSAMLGGDGSGNLIILNGNGSIPGAGLICNTINVTGESKLNGGLSVNGKMTVAAATGNTTITGTTTSTGNLTVGVNKFTVNSSNGDTVTYGALNVIAGLQVNSGNMSVDIFGNISSKGTIRVVSTVDSNHSGFMKMNGNTLEVYGENYGNVAYTKIKGTALNNVYGVTIESGATNITGNLQIGSHSINGSSGVFTGSASTLTGSLDGSKITGTITNATIPVANVTGSLNGSKITGTITTATISASQVTGLNQTFTLNVASI